MADETDPHPEQGIPTAIWVLGWLLWVLEVAGFVFLAGCTALFGAEFSSSSPTMFVSLIGATGVFIYAMVVTFDRSKTGKPRLLTGITLLLLAGFMVFGACVISVK